MLVYHVVLDVLIMVLTIAVS